MSMIKLAFAQTDASAPQCPRRKQLNIQPRSVCGLCVLPLFITFFFVTGIHPHNTHSVLPPTPTPTPTQRLKNTPELE